MEKRKKHTITWIAILGAVIVMLMLGAGTFWIGQNAREDTGEAVRAVSLLYLDELAGRRSQVVENNLQNKIRDLRVAVSLLEADDLKDIEHLQAYQGKIRQLYNLNKFAFVDTNGLIYTSRGTQDNIDDYSIGYRSLTEPEISIFNLQSPDKQVIIAVPVDLDFQDQKLIVCFMEIDMHEMLSGASITSAAQGATFCNLYTRDGIALTDTVLGGIASETNLLEAMNIAEFEPGYSYDGFLHAFRACESGAVSFSYKGIRETLSYVPIEGTDWQLTYLIRESVISQEIGAITDGILQKSIVQSLLTVLTLLVLFLYILSQGRKNARLSLQHETAAAEARIKQEEMEQQLALQQALSDALAAAEQANRAKTSFLSSMSHEIRTPMNAIIGLDSIALNDPDISEKTRGYLEKIGSSADHLLSLINDILDMSRIESGRMTLHNEEFSFPKLLEQVNTIFSGQCQDKGLDYQCRMLSEVDDYYIGDNMKLRQVLINILGNAVKFTPEGGKVELLVERTAHYDNKTAIRFTISDTGIGMSKDYLPHIFDTFSQEDDTATNRYGSSGLGMAITKNIVDMMNGSIEVESEKGKGSVFIVTVTLSDSERKDAGEDSEEIHPGEMTVLIIDDDPIACEHAQLVLNKAGIAAETASSGREAIDMVAVRHARRDPYNLILVDWKMPEMDGVETTRQLREIIGSESAIIILTAYRWDDVLEEATAAGVDSFLSKPLFAGSVMEEFRTAAKRKNLLAADKVQKADLNGRRILVAEDVQINAEILLMILQSRGMEGDLAENGRIAVEKYASHPAGYYDAVLMDMRMPEMDGLEATKKIRSLEREDSTSIPIIALTANAFDEDVQRSLQAGLNAHLSKPVEPEILYETLEGLIK